MDHPYRSAMYITMTTIIALLLAISSTATAQFGFSGSTNDAPSDPYRGEPQTPSECATGVHMIAIRGTSFNPADQGTQPDDGQGQLEPITKTVIDSNLGSGKSDVVGLVYPASPDIWNSVADGQESLKETLGSYVERCPDSKISIVGFSQGAIVLSHTLCRGDLDAYAGQITSALSFGNPSEIANGSYNRGTSQNDGKLDPVDCSVYKDIYRAWCDKGDVWCDSEGENDLTHIAYFGKDEYMKQAVDFIETKAGLKSKGSDDTEDGPFPVPSSSQSDDTQESTTSSAGIPGPNSGSQTSDMCPRHRYSKALGFVSLVAAVIA